MEEEMKKMSQYLETISKAEEVKRIESNSTDALDYIANIAGAIRRELDAYMNNSNRKFESQIGSVKFKRPGDYPTVLKEHMKKVIEVELHVHPYSYRIQKVKQVFDYLFFEMERKDIKIKSVDGNEYSSDSIDGFSYKWDVFLEFIARKKYN